MSVEKGFRHVTFELMDKLLGVSDLGEALSGTLEVITRALDSEAGAVWLLDQEKDVLTPVFQMGPADLSNVIIRNGKAVEGEVTKSGESLLVSDATWDPRFDGTAFDHKGLATKTMICVPVKNINDGSVIGCMLVINRNDGTRYGEEELDLCEQAADLASKTISGKGFLVVSDEKKQVLVTFKDAVKKITNGENVSKILRGINLNIYKNEFVVLLGEPGSGNSAIMNVAGGMDTLTEGIMTFEDNDYSMPTEEWLTQFRRDFVGMVFKTNNLMPNLTALENVEFIAELSEDSISAWDALDKIDMAEFAGEYPANLTPGQKQCIAIAKAIVKKPHLIIVDNPTAALDYNDSIMFLSCLEKVVTDRSTTIVMATRNAEIAKMADRVVSVKRGKIVSIKKNIHPLHAEELVW